MGSKDYQQRGGRGGGGSTVWGGAGLTVDCSSRLHN